MLALDDSVLYVDQVENLIEFCPTKEEIDLLKVSNPFSCVNKNFMSRGVNNLETIDAHLSYSYTSYAGVYWR